MRPDGDELPAIIRKALVDYVAPEVTSVYGRTQLTYALTLLAQLARESDGAAARLVEEASELRHLLQEAAGRLEGPGLDGGLLAEVAALAAPQTPQDLRLSALRAERSRLYEALIRLQGACASAPAGGAAADVHSSLVAYLRGRLEAQSPMR
jgi:hypothetical protein